MALAACRSCGGRDLHLVLSLGEMPPANALPTDPDEDQKRYELTVVMCDACSLLQLTETVPPADMFVEYAYFSSRSTPMVEHARSLVDEVMRARNLGPTDRVIEIASNDGYLLQHYRDQGIPVLGIDPAENVVDVAISAGIPTRAAFFTHALATELRDEGLSADVVHANNVLAHVPDINDLVAGVATVLREGGAFVVETPYVRDLIEKLEFDTIYHEHVFYYSMLSIVGLFARNGLTVVDVHRIPIHGGSLRITAMRSGDGVVEGERVSNLLSEERALGMNEGAFYAGFAGRVRSLIDDLRGLLRERRDQGRRIAGYGAAAKASVLLNALGVGPETVGFVVDETPYKQGRFIPGVRIPIFDPGELASRKPDDVVIFAWNFADAILAKEAAHLDRGGSFIIPIPEPKVIPS